MNTSLEQMLPLNQPKYEPVISWAQIYWNRYHYTNRNMSQWSPEYKPTETGATTPTEIWTSDLLNTYLLRWVPLHQPKYEPVISWPHIYWDGYHYTKPCGLRLIPLIILQWAATVLLIRQPKVDSSSSLWSCRRGITKMEQGKISSIKDDVPPQSYTQGKNRHSHTINF